MEIKFSRGTGTTDEHGTAIIDNESGTIQFNATSRVTNKVRLEEIEALVSFDHLPGYAAAIAELLLCNAALTGQLITNGMTPTIEGVTMPLNIGRLKVLQEFLEGGQL